MVTSLLLPFDLEGTLKDWAPILVALGTAFTGLAAVVGGSLIAFRFESNHRDAIRLRQEQWRISYGNLNLTSQHVLTYPAIAPVRAATLSEPREVTQFLIFRLDVQNIGDGPVDVWACLVAARELNAGDHKESWGGNVEWNDLDPYYFDTTVKEWEGLAGISNTRHTVYSQDDYIQLDPKESDTLTRIDRIQPVDRHLTLVYRVFLVGRGYGGQARNLHSVRDMLAWQQVQQAMFNISGPSFRILFDLDDPLDLVADRDGFQCFMLYHSGFVDDNRDGIGWTVVDHLNGKLEADWGATHSEDEARREIERVVAPYKAKWQRHWTAIEQAYAECKRQPMGFAGLMKTDWKPNLPGPAPEGGDITTMPARQAFKKLSSYLAWNPEDEETLPIWEKFFVITLDPSDATTDTATLPRLSSAHVAR